MTWGPAMSGPTIRLRSGLRSSGAGCLGRRPRRPRRSGRPGRDRFRDGMRRGDRHRTLGPSRRGAVERRAMVAFDRGMEQVALEAALAAHGYPSRAPCYPLPGGMDSRRRRFQDPPGLLEADVNFKVVAASPWPSRSVRSATRCWTSLNPGQQVIKIVHEELTELMGEPRDRSRSRRSRRRDPDGGPAGLGQDHRLRQARHAASRHEGKDVRSSRATSTAPPRSSSSGRSAGRPARPSTSRAPTATRATSPNGRSTRRAATSATW